MQKKSTAGNQALYPLVFLILMPLAGACAAMEFGLFDSIPTGAFWGAVLGSICYAAWRLPKRAR
ncbi:hypothetical protein SDC9_195684 [bioreactor metagenome]|uniref:Uncharacterized protein n=1 Tax=bioreactor metagenome TaxID=1076179 RepID=A0A645IAD3_9ZZZZ